MTEAMPFLQKTILLSYDPRPFRRLFLAHCNRIDASPQFCTQNQIEAQGQRVRFGKEEQESGRMVSFWALGIKRRRSKANFAPTWWR